MDTPCTGAAPQRQAPSRDLFRECRTALAAKGIDLPAGTIERSTPNATSCQLINASTLLEATYFVTEAGNDALVVTVRGPGADQQWRYSSLDHGGAVRA